VRVRAGQQLWRLRRQVQPWSCITAVQLRMVTAAEAAAAWKGWQDVAVGAAPFMSAVAATAEIAAAAAAGGGGRGGGVDAVGGVAVRDTHVVAAMGQVQVCGPPCVGV
jgi:hypothetical protein